MNRAVLLVSFNRKEYLQKVFAAVATAKPPRLYLSSDGPRPNKSGEAEVVNDIRNWMVANVNWPCEVKTRFLEVNSGGCGPGVSGAITWFFQNEKDGIIVEDDCVPSPTFFKLCEECLDRYADDKRVWSIGGHSTFSAKIKESYFFARLPMSWGWATWADRWAEFDLAKWKYDPKIFDCVSECPQVKDHYMCVMEQGARGQIDSWAYPWAFVVFAHNGLCVVPKENLVSNCGLVGVHFSLTEAEDHSRRFNTPVSNFPRIVHPRRVELDKKNNERFLARRRSPRTPFRVRILQKAYSLLSAALKRMKTTTSILRVMVPSLATKNDEINLCHSRT